MNADLHHGPMIVTSLFKLPSIMCRTEDLHLMLRQLRDDQREESADETVAHCSVNFEQKSRNLSQRKWYVAGSGINVAVKYLDSGYDG